MICLLARLARERLGEAGRLDDLLGLAQVAVRAGRDDVLGQEPGADELLGDRRGAALALARRRSRRRPPTIAAGSKPSFAQNVRSSAVVVASRTSFGTSSNVDDAPLLALEPPELDLAGAVVDDRRLGERQLVEVDGIGQVLRQGADRGDGRRPRPRRARR